jgi:hypothetical protein
MTPLAAVSDFGGRRYHRFVPICRKNRLLSSIQFIVCENLSTVSLTPVNSLSAVSLTLANNLSAVSKKIRNGLKGILRGPRKTDL